MSSPSLRSGSLSTGSDSPVSADSSVFSELALTSLASAGTMSPASSTRMSPGTTFCEDISFICPSLSTLAWGTDIFFSSSIALSALFSCITPSRALSTTIIIIISESVKSASPLRYDTPNDAAEAARSIIIITSLSCSKNFFIKLLCLISPPIVFSPFSSSLFSASSSSNPLFTFV